ncbi:MAG TPA: hypothetical protein VHC69_29020 [Polyangiaceae bacterium]|nr:hypothetical protein [Polyangiaceae bacterium]
MKAAPGVAYGALGALLLVACATAQTIGNNELPGGDSNGGSVADAGHRRDSGTVPAAGGNASSGGGPSMSSGGAEPGSTTGSAGSGAGGATDASGGSGGATQHDAAAGGAPSDGGSAGAGGTTSAGGSTVQGTGGTCAAGQKPCDGACATEVPANGCSATSCSACPIPAPANGIQICDAQGQCDFECLSGYEKNGAVCTMGGGSVDAGSGGAPTLCGRQTCHRCLGNLVGCCDKQGEQCLCVLRNQMNLCGP